MHNSVIIGILLLGAAFALAVYIVKCIIEQLAPQVNRNVTLIVDLAGVVGFLYAGVKGVWTRIYGNKGNNGEQSKSIGSFLFELKLQKNPIQRSSLLSYKTKSMDKFTPLYCYI